MSGAGSPEGPRDHLSFEDIFGEEDFVLLEWGGITRLTIRHEVSAGVFAKLDIGQALTHVVFNTTGQHVYRRARDERGAQYQNRGQCL